MKGYLMKFLISILLLVSFIQCNNSNQTKTIQKMLSEKQSRDLDLPPPSYYYLSSYQLQYLSFGPVTYFYYTFNYYYSTINLVSSYVYYTSFYCFDNCNNYSLSYNSNYYYYYYGSNYYYYYNYYYNYQQVEKDGNRGAVWLGLVIGMPILGLLIIITFFIVLCCCCLKKKTLADGTKTIVCRKSVRNCTCCIKKSKKTHQLSQSQPIIIQSQPGAPIIYTMNNQSMGPMQDVGQNQAYPVVYQVQSAQPMMNGQPIIINPDIHQVSVQTGIQIQQKEETFM